ncbi:unnamed protein product [Adineta ricciae]|nr:unnamed protein product [Adineta ricciae]
MTGSMNSRRYFHAGSILVNGKVLVTGGDASSGLSLDSADLYDPSLGSWTTTGNLNGARFGHTASILSNERVLATGGYDSTNYLNTAELY